MDSAISPPSRPSHTVGAVSSAVRILRYLASVGEPVRLVRVVSDLQLNKSTCLNILRTLVDEGLVTHHPAAKTYALGQGLVDMARGALMGLAERDLVQPLLDSFSIRHMLSVILWRRIGRELVVIAHSAEGTPVHIKALIGTRVPLLTGSMGRVIAGCGKLDEVMLRAAFTERDGPDPLSFDAYMAEAARVRECGWSGDSASLGDIRNGLAAPVPADGEIEKVVSAVLIANQFTPDELPAVGEALVNLGEDIARVSARRGGGRAR